MQGNYLKAEADSAPERVDERGSNPRLAPCQGKDVKTQRGSC